LKGSRGGPGAIDATVFWNYVDLRVVAVFDFRIDVELTQDELVVRLRATDAPRSAAQKPPALIPIAADMPSTPVARGCLTCDETDCFRHLGRTTMRSGKSARARQRMGDATSGRRRAAASRRRWSSSAGKACTNTS